jgi:hypothetical protein
VRFEIVRFTVLASLTLFSYAIGWAIGAPAAVPILNTLPAFTFMYAALRRGQTSHAIVLMLGWAAVMGIGATLVSYLDPARTAALFLNGERYAAEMMLWVRTGIGEESSPIRFVPSHAAHAAVFCALSLATGSVISMVMGAVLMNYMGHYVGRLAAVSARPALTACLAWAPWSLVRIASFVVLGVVLGGPLLSRLGRFPFRLRAHARWLALAAGGLFLDVVLKWLMAPAWSRLLRAVVGW